MLSWAGKRQLLFIVGFIVILTLFAGGYYFTHQKTGTCFDSKKNQGELGVDCGGPCALACPSQVLPIKILWTRLFPIGPGRYDAVSLVENQNYNFGVKEIGYKYKILDDQKIAITDKTGITFMNPRDKFILFEPGINTKQRAASDAILYFDTAPAWSKLTSAVPKVSIEQSDFTSDPTPRLRVTVHNDSLVDLRRVEFDVVLSDKDYNAIAASKTMVDLLKSGQTTDINFSWPTKLTADPVYKDIYPRVNALNLKQPN